MLKIHVPPKEWYDEKRNEFISFDGADIELEHSLYSISEWESKWEKPFAKDSAMKRVEFLDYVRCMALNKVDKLAYLSLTNKNVADINNYIKARHTATWFQKTNAPNGRRSETITSELVYYWMIEHGIPFSCDRWNFNRLMTLIEVCNRKNSKPGKRNQNDMLLEQHRLNMERRKRLNTNG